MREKNAPQLLVVLLKLYLVWPSIMCRSTSPPFRLLPAPTAVYAWWMMKEIRCKAMVSTLWRKGSEWVNWGDLFSTRSADSIMCVSCLRRVRVESTRARANLSHTGLHLTPFLSSHRINRCVVGRLWTAFDCGEASRRNLLASFQPDVWVVLRTRRCGVRLHELRIPPLLLLQIVLTWRNLLILYSLGRSYYLEVCF
jgi:hypothetical protein